MWTCNKWYRSSCPPFKSTLRWFRMENTEGRKSNRCIWNFSYLPRLMNGYLKKTQKNKATVKLFLCSQLEYFCSSLESVGEKKCHHAKKQIKPKLEYDLSLMTAGVEMCTCFNGNNWKKTPTNPNQKTQPVPSCGEWIWWANRRMCVNVTGGYSKDRDSCQVLLLPHSCLLGWIHEHIERLVLLEH